MKLGRDILEEYQAWLVDFVSDGLPEHRNYGYLLHDLGCKEFTWTLLMDEQRDIDGLYLRRDFMNKYHIDMDSSFYKMPRSVFEVLAAFSRTIEIQITGTQEYDNFSRFFWIMLDNLGLLKYSDERYNVNKVYEILDNWMGHFSDESDNPNIFPLKNSKTDKSKIDMWYRMQFWLRENWTF